MKIISTKLHGVLDYCVGFLLVASTWLPGLPTGNGPFLFALLAGIAILVLALFTDYEAGLVHFVPVPLHLFFDILIGVFLAIIPWLTRLHGAYAWVYFLTGVLEILLVLLSETSPRKASYSPTHKR